MSSLSSSLNFNNQTPQVFENCFRLHIHHSHPSIIDCIESTNGSANAQIIEKIINIRSNLLADIEYFENLKNSYGKYIDGNHRIKVEIENDQALLKILDDRLKLYMDKMNQTTVGESVAEKNVEKITTISPVTDPMVTTTPTKSSNETEINVKTDTAEEIRQKKIMTPKNPQKWTRQNFIFSYAASRMNNKIYNFVKTFETEPIKIFEILNVDKKYFGKFLTDLGIKSLIGGEDRGAYGYISDDMDKYLGNNQVIFIQISTNWEKDSFEFTVHNSIKPICMARESEDYEKYIFSMIANIRGYQIDQSILQSIGGYNTIGKFNITLLD